MQLCTCISYWIYNNWINTASFKTNEYTCILPSCFHYTSLLNFDTVSDFNSIFKCFSKRTNRNGFHCKSYLSLLLRQYITILKTNDRTCIHNRFNFKEKYSERLLLVKETIKIIYIYIYTWNLPWKIFVLVCTGIYVW